jgi:hypothetical protein
MCYFFVTYCASSFTFVFISFFVALLVYAFIMLSFCCIFLPFSVTPSLAYTIPQRWNLVPVKSANYSYTK